METLLINEKFISQFKFWLDGQVQQGMRFRHDLFTHVAEFKSSQRHDAFDLAWKLSQNQGQQVIITATNLQYTVWLTLRSPESETGLPAAAPQISVQTSMQTSVQASVLVAC